MCWYHKWILKHKKYYFDVILNKNHYESYSLPQFETQSLSINYEGTIVCFVHNKEAELKFF